MKVEDVLSEILGVPCGNVKFYREGTSSLLSSGVYLHTGPHTFINWRIEFSTWQRISTTFPECKFGSLYVCSEGWYSTEVSMYREYGYAAYLHKGEETSRIIRAIADELVSD